MVAKWLLCGTALLIAAPAFAKPVPTKSVSVYRTQPDDPRAITVKGVGDGRADDSVALDRTLDTRRFRDATGYVPAPWPALLAKMRAFG